VVTLLFQYYCQCVKCSFEHFINCSAYSCGQQNWVCSFNRKQHWLPVTFRITFKLACLTYKLLTTGQPAYLHTLLLHYTTTGTMWLTNQFFLDVPRFSTEFGKRSFSYLAPIVWNELFLNIRLSLTFNTLYKWYPPSDCWCLWFSIITELTLSNPVPWQNWMAAYLSYTLRMKTVFCGWPVMVDDTHTTRRRRLNLCTL